MMPEFECVENIKYSENTRIVPLPAMQPDATLRRSVGTCRHPVLCQSGREAVLPLYSTER